MKKKLLIVLFCFLSTALAAQNGKRVVVGISVGPSIDWLTPRTDGYDGNGAIVGLRYGVPVDINFTQENNYYFTTGVLFSHTGGKLKFPDYLTGQTTEVVNTHRKYNSLYISIPTGVKLKTPSFGNFVFGGNFGFYHGFLLSSKKLDHYDNSGDMIKQTKKSDYKETNFFKESLYVGLGAEYIIRDDFRVTAYINYSYTLTNYFKNKVHNSYTGARERANLGCVELLLGVTF